MEKHTLAPMSRMLHWWRERGEPVALTGLLLGAMTIVLLLGLGVIELRLAVRLLGGVGWLTGALLLLRLPRWLQNEQRRMYLLGGLGAATLITALVLQPAHASIARTNPELAQALMPLAQSESLTFQAPPRISRQSFARIMERGTGGGTSPAAAHADELYTIITEYGLDPAVALAFFAHESQLCTTGVCQVYDTKSWGALRAAYKRSRAIDVVKVSSGSFVRYGTWQDGLRDWCELIINRYIARGMDTVAEAVPVYAPESDGNVPTSYINAIHRTVALWQGRDPGPPVVAALRSYSETLDVALVRESFIASDLEFHPTWAFHTYMLDQARVGKPLGSPISESYRIAVGGQQYAVQVFTLDTIYTPLAKVEHETNWGDVRRLSDLLRKP